MLYYTTTLRGGAVVARQAHNLKAVGSIPAPATNRIFNRLKRRFFCAQIAPFSLFSDTFINLVAGQGLLHIFPTFIPQCGELTATSFAQSEVST